MKNFRQTLIMWSLVSVSLDEAIVFMNCTLWTIAGVFLIKGWSEQMIQHNDGILSRNPQ